MLVLPAIGILRLEAPSGEDEDSIPSATNVPLMPGWLLRNRPQAAPIAVRSLSCHRNTAISVS